MQSYLQVRVAKAYQARMQNLEHLCALHKVELVRLQFREQLYVHGSLPYSIRHFRCGEWLVNLRRCIY